jgi:PAS domain S-box-containing protein
VNGTDAVEFTQGLIYNLSMVVALSVIAGFMRPSEPSRKRHQVLLGLFFGLVAIISIFTPVKVPDTDIQFDGRSVALSICALFFGPVAGVIAGLMAMVCRLGIGGTGTLTGVLVIISSVAIGLYFRRILEKRKAEPTSLQLYVFSLIVHAAMLLMFFAMPWQVALRVLAGMAFPVIFFYPLAGLLTGRILADQRANHLLLQKLTDRDERYRTMFDAVPSIAIQTFDQDGTVLSWNKGSEIFYGYTAEEAVGRNFTDLIIPPETLARYNEEFEKSKRDGVVIPDVEVTLRRKDGSHIIVFSRNGTIRIPGRPVEYFAMDVDLTHRRQIEEQLRAQERILANAQRIAQLGSWELDVPTGRLVWSNEIFSIFGITRENFGGDFDAFLSLIHPEDREAFLVQQNAALRGEKPLDWEHRIVRTDGMIRYVHERGELTLDESGAPARLSGTVQDITDRRLADEARAQAEHLAKSTVDALSAHIAILDQDGLILAVNGSWRNFAEQNEGSLSHLCEGVNYLDVCDQVDDADSCGAQEVAQGIRSVLSGKLSEFAFEYPCHSPNEQRWYIARVTRFGEAERVRVVVAHENITDRKLAEEKLLADEDRFQRQRNALIALMDIDAIDEDDLAGSLQKLTEVTASTMQIARVGIWRFNGACNAIECADLYELEHDRHSRGTVVRAEQCPGYFRALSETNLISADDAHNNPNTIELAEGYLIPLGITSMLDAPVHFGGTVDGVLCCEHVGPPRAWTQDEKTFAIAVANMVSLALEGWERRRTEIALRNSLKELSDFRAALDEHAIVSIADASGRITFANEKFCEISKYSLDELLGQDHRLINSGYHPPEFFADMWHTIAAGKVFKGEIRNRAKDGSHYWVSASIVPYLDDDGKPYQYVAVRTDITHRKRVEEELHGLNERLRHYLSVSPTITYALRMIDGTMMPVWVSENIQQVLGYSAEDCLEPGWWLSHVHIDDRERVLENQHIIQSTGSLSHEYRFVRKDGRVVWMRDDLRMAHSDDTTAEKEFVGAWTEITDRKQGEEERDRLEAQLVQSQKMESIGRLAGGVAHDFNNMLSVIIGHAEMALEETDNRHPLRPDLDEIMRTSQRAAEITKQLLAFARRQTSAPRVLNLNDTISSMLTMLRRLTAANIELKWEPGADLWSVKIDPAQVDQILANLIVNASDAIQGPGSITIRTRNVPSADQDSGDDSTPMFMDLVELIVSDTGCGMPEEVIPHIFDPFFTTKDVGKGTGLGLATVYGILHQNRGTVDVTSAPGQGTTFQIRLPRFSSVEDFRDKTPAGGTRVMGVQETVLLVEDEQALLSLGVRFLKRLGYKVFASSDPREAVRLFQQNKDEINILMTDVVMPEMSGREVWEAVSAIRPDLRCLFVSGYTADVIATHGILSEGVHFLQKPYTVDALGRKLREVLDA